MLWNVIGKSIDPFLIESSIILEKKKKKKKRLELGRLVVDEKSRQEDFMILA